MLRRWRGGFDKQQRVYLVEIGAARMKQLVLPDSALAAEIAQNLEHLAHTKLFPRLIARHRGELWLEYIEGKTLDPDVPPSIASIADVFARLYRVDNRCVRTADEPFVEQILNELHFLESTGIVSAETASSLAGQARGAAPATIWVGYDYGDARSQNLVEMPDGRLRVIDVESIRRGALIGTGVVRALSRWPLDRVDLFAHLERSGTPPFWTYMSFLEIAFLTAWTKRCVLYKKHALIDHAALERLAAGRGSA